MPPSPHASEPGNGGPPDPILIEEAFAVALDGSPEQAVSALLLALGPEGDSPRCRLAIARLMLVRDRPGDRNEAVAELRTLAEEGGEVGWRAALQLARTARRDGAVEEAATHLRSALDTFRGLSPQLGASGSTLSSLIASEVRELQRRSASAETSDESSTLRRGVDVAALLRIVEFGKHAAALTDPEELLALILDEAIRLSGMERGFLVLVHGDELEYAMSRAIDRADVGKPEFAVSRTLVREVVRTGRPSYIDEPLELDQRSAGASLSDRGVRSVACVPITGGGVLSGVLYVDHRTRRRRMDGPTSRVLELFAGQAGGALQNLRAHEAKRRALETAEEALRLHREVDEWSAEFEPLVGRTAVMEELFRRLERIFPTEAPVLIRGETGTGKDLVAQMIHRRGPRAAGEYVAFNCAGVPESLLEDQLFGHERGAFTGAVQAHAGLFEVAHRGTLFLDEVGDMSPRMQSALLRVLESGEVRRLGGRERVEVDVRILAATHRDLEAMVEAGTFRRDLFFRLNVLSVSLPPLRERTADVPLLVDALWKHRGGGELPSFAPEAMQRLMDYRWPGNVRELENVLERLIVLGVPVVRKEHLPHEISAPSLPPTRAGTLREAEQAAIRRALEQAGGNKALAARILEIDRKTLYLKLKAMGE